MCLLISDLASSIVIIRKVFYLIISQQLLTKPNVQIMFSQLLFINTF